MLMVLALLTRAIVEELLGDLRNAKSPLSTFRVAKSNLASMIKVRKAVEAFLSSRPVDFDGDPFALCNILCLYYYRTGRNEAAIRILRLAIRLADSGPNLRGASQSHIQLLRLLVATCNPIQTIDVIAVADFIASNIERLRLLDADNNTSLPTDWSLAEVQVRSLFFNLYDAVGNGEWLQEFVKHSIVDEAANNEKFNSTDLQVIARSLLRMRDSTFQLNNLNLRGLWNAKILVLNEDYLPSVINDVMGFEV